MRMVDLIEKKRDGFELSNEEISFIINGYTKKLIPDYQMSSFLMAVYFKGMTKNESFALTKAMLESGDVIDLSSIDGIKVDKHSTGGVGDKTSLVISPIVAASGAKLAKLSGRGLGHTGGTLDKLESIPGVTINLPIDRFINQVKEIGMAVAGQTQELVPADKLMYALRDVTGTVPSVPLIASSIMSKKLASGADVICLDVKIGDGAFMKTIEDATTLSKEMISIGKSFGKKVCCFVTEMDEPLGLNVGNRLEVLEAINTLKGNGPEDFNELCLTISSYMISFAKNISVEEARNEALEILKSGRALNKFYEFIEAQGATTKDIENIIDVKKIIPVKATKAGYIHHLLALHIGLAAMKLGAGREKKEDSIDPSVGIVLKKKVGDKVNIGDTLALLYVNDKYSEEIYNEVLDSFEIKDEYIDKPKVIKKIITEKDL